MNKPLVSITIPTFNRKNMLEKCLESVINQTYKNLEIIVSDNHSEDGTEEYMLDMAQKDKRIRYFRHEENRGIGFQGEFLTNIATGEFWATVCDDDWIDLNYIEECLKILQNSDILFTYGTVKLFSENYELKKVAKTVVLDENDYKTRIANYIKKGPSNYLASLFARTEEIKLTSDYTKNRFCEDQFFIAKHLLLGKCVCSNKTFYNKVDNGCTKDLESLKKAYNLPQHLDYKNYWHFLAQAYDDCIQNDEFFKIRLNDAERKELSAAAKKACIEKMIESEYDILKYAKNHILFLFRKKFYEIIKERIALYNKYRQ